MSTTALVLYAILTMTTRKIDCLEIDNDWKWKIVLKCLGVTIEWSNIMWGLKYSTPGGGSCIGACQNNLVLKKLHTMKWKDKQTTCVIEFFWISVFKCLITDQKHSLIA